MLNNMPLDNEKPHFHIETKDSRNLSNVESQNYQHLLLH